MGWFSSPFPTTRTEPPSQQQQGESSSLLPPAAAAAASKEDKSNYYAALDEEGYAGGNVPVAVAVLADDENPPPMNPAFTTATADFGDFQQRQQASAAVAVVPTAPVDLVTAPFGDGTTGLSSTSPQYQYQQRQQQQHTRRSLVLYLKRSPTLLAQCPLCRASNVRTRARTYPSWATWGTCVAIFFVFAPLCWVPLVLDVAKRTDHTCNACHNNVGSIYPYQDCCVKYGGHARRQHRQRW